MPAPINIYLESATHYAQDLNGETDAISRSAFERQLLECLIISGLKTDYKLSLLNEILKGDMFDDFWKGIKDRLHLLDVQLEPYEPDPKLCLPPHTIYAATESTYNQCVGETAARESAPEAEDYHCISGTEAEGQDDLDALVDLRDRTPPLATPYPEENNSGSHYQFVEQHDNSWMTQTSPVELEEQYIQRTYPPSYHHVRIVDYEHEVDKVHKRLEKEDGVYRPNQGLRLNIEKTSKGKRKTKKGGRRVRGNGIQGGSSMDIVERSLAVMDAQKKKAEMADKIEIKDGHGAV